MAYVTLADFKLYLKNELPTEDDAFLTSVLASAQTTLNIACQRSFDVAGVAAARVFAPNGTNLLRIHDATTVTVVSDNGSTVSASDYQLEPLNLLTWAQETRPYEQIRRTSGAPFYSTFNKATVTVTATWGWAATPTAVVEATKVIGKDIAANRDVQLGIVTVTDAGAASARNNAFVVDTIRKYRRLEALGIG